MSVPSPNRAGEPILSPEAYISRPVEVNFKDIQCRPNRAATTTESLVMPYKFYWTNIPIPHYGFIRALRSARLQTIRTEPDEDRSGNSTEVVAKYCSPVARLINCVVLSQDVPPIRVLNKHDIDLNIEYPIALFVSGTQGKGCPITSLSLDQWHKPTMPGSVSSRRPNEPPDWSKLNKCFVVVMFMNQGELQSCNLHDQSEIITRLEPPNVQDAFVSLTAVMAKTRAVFGIITDEITCLVADCCQSTGLEDGPTLTTMTTAKLHLRLLIGSCIYDIAEDWDMVKIYSQPPLHWVLGALNDDHVLQSAMATFETKQRRWFSDFDLYTMQRVPELWDQLVEWHQRSQDAALKCPIVSGSSIHFETGGLARNSGLLRSPYPYFQLPTDTLHMIKGGRSRRRRNATLDDLIRSSRELSLTVVEVVRSGVRHYSQVFFARIIGCDEIVCIKLLDERYFPIPKDYIDDDAYIFTPPTRLASLNHSEDLARREEGIYDRLEDLQGWLLPHCYGFHLFTMADGWQCYGTILERISGQTLGDAYSSYTSEIRLSIVKQIHHGVRALRAAGVSQTDWHPSQILCLPRSGDHVHVIFIDFAFGLMYLGDEAGMPVRGDLAGVRYMLRSVLEVDETILKQAKEEPLEFEW